MVGGNIISKLFKSKKEKCEKKAEKDCNIEEIKKKMIDDEIKNINSRKNFLDYIKGIGKYDTTIQGDSQARALQASEDLKKEFRASKVINDKKLRDSLTEPAIREYMKCKEEKIEQCIKNKKK